MAARPGEPAESAAPAEHGVPGVVAYLGLGSNLGDRAAAIRTALRELAEHPGIELLATSRLRATSPVGGPPQPDYLNGVAAVRTTLGALELLRLCKALELRAGRDLGAPRNAPRPLDLDLLLYGDERIDTGELRVPHPRIAEREFVLVPLRELGVDPRAIAAAGEPGAGEPGAGEPAAGAEV